MITRDALDAYLNTYLQSARYTGDYVPNGLQIEGTDSIKKICTAVTASQTVIEQAIQADAQALLVHHGFFWRSEPACLTGIKGKRIASLLRHNINLFAYHLPLDAHPVIGNNACIAHLLQLINVTQHTVAQTPDLLWMGTLPTPISHETFLADLTNTFSRTPVAIQAHARPIETIAFCSGAAQDFITYAQKLGADAYISGEISERTYYDAQEGCINYYACGHHATERYGIQALGQHIAREYHLDHLFLDSDNPV